MYRKSDSSNQNFTENAGFDWEKLMSEQQALHQFTTLSRPCYQPSQMFDDWACSKFHAGRFNPHGSLYQDWGRYCSGSLTARLEFSTVSGPKITGKRQSMKHNSSILYQAIKFMARPARRAVTCGNGNYGGAAGIGGHWSMEPGQLGT